MYIILFEHGVGHYQCIWSIEEFPDPILAQGSGLLVIFSSYPCIEVSYQQELVGTVNVSECTFS